jgi:multicomponent Na+:H+ antiporter subunit D
MCLQWGPLPFSEPGSSIKVAIVPFHFWLADAYATAPLPVCFLLGGVVSELGLYALARVNWTCVFLTAG